jgi:hypothetical protein
MWIDDLVMDCRLHTVRNGSYVAGQGKEKQECNCQCKNAFFLLTVLPWQADGVQDGYSSAYGYVGYSSLRVVDFPTPKITVGQVHALPGKRERDLKSESASEI